MSELMLRVIRLTLVLSCVTGQAYSEEAFTLKHRFSAPEARQAVAADAEHAYVIDNATIGKYELASGDRVDRWEASDDLPLRHLNSAIVRNGQLICAHSNYPRVPEASSVEVWDTETLRHVKSHSFGIYDGSLTWVDWKDDAWWAVFANYTKAANKEPQARDTRWTSLVKFDSQWRRLGGWVFPEEVIERFQPHSCSGGAWGPDGALYCTGHDRAEVYRLTLPQAGSTLKLTHVLAAPIAGQGIAWSADGKLLLGIHRAKREVVVCRPPNGLLPVSSS